MDSVRINYNKCGEQSFLAFIKNINKNKDFVFRAHNPADSTVMQDRYTYAKNKNRVSIVYETKAQTLIITAPQGVIGDVAALVPNEVSGKEEKSAQDEQRVFVREAAFKENKQNKPNKTADKSKSAEPKSKASKNKSADQNSSDASDGKSKLPIKNEQNGLGANARQTNHGTRQQSGGSKPKKDGVNQAVTKQTKQSIKSKSKDAVNKDVSEQSKKEPINISGNKFTIKKVDENKFNELLKKIKANKAMRYKGVASNDSVRSYLVSSVTEKAMLKYDGDVQLIGNRGDLYSELQLMMSQISDYKTAIKSHIKYSGEEKRAKDVERQLKKKLPSAFEFLSEQSKIDLAIGLIDINNSAVVLSDYSTLLIPCFRGLERLIFDLQHAQGIVVKMIGQAYEKENGNYVLKSGYRRKIPSVIYAEVMAALYTEYFKHRNFYAHSDGGYDNVSRVITDKQQVQTIFNAIMEVINYNGKKLKEIGFTI